MKKLIIIVAIVMNLIAGTGCYVDNYEMRSTVNDNLQIRSHLITVGFATNSKVYSSDKPVIIHRHNGRIVSINTPSVGYNYIKGESAIQADININSVRGKHSFELWVSKVGNKHFVKKFTIGTNKVASNPYDNEYSNHNNIYHNMIVIIK